MRKAAVSPRKSAGTQQILQSQTSGILKFPLELFLEIFSYLNDHRDFIKGTYHVGFTAQRMERKDVERSTVIRNLTMTCWPLRNVLLPVLWKDAEGCALLPAGRKFAYGLYAQCEYLLSNPAVAVHVQVFSVELLFESTTAGERLTKKFVDTLLRLPNLRRLELLSASYRSPVSSALKHKRATFPSVREMLVGDSYPEFIQSCPNLESLTIGHHLDTHTCRAIQSYGAGLKRVTGIDFRVGPDRFVRHIIVLAEGCPRLQEIGLLCDLRSRDYKDFNELRRIEHLAIVEVYLVKYKHQPTPPPDVVKDMWNDLQRVLIRVLKNCTSKDRKLLRWRAAGETYPGDDCPLFYGFMESGEVEVFPKTPL